MNAASCFFRLCRQRQLQSNFTGTARKATRPSSRPQTRAFISLRPLCAELIDVAAQPELPPGKPYASTSNASPTWGLTTRPDELFCGNLDPGLLKEQVEEVFRKYGTITSISLGAQGEKGSGNDGWGKHNGGFCFIKFATAAEARAAAEGMNGVELAGKPLNVHFAEIRVRKFLKGTSRKGGAIEPQPGFTERDEEFVRTEPTTVGTVCQTGRMNKTVVVKTKHRYLDKTTQTHHVREKKVLVRDKDNILREGDVIKYQHFPPDWYEQRVKRGKTNVRHVLREVVTPFGSSVEDRMMKALNGLGTSPEDRGTGKLASMAG